MANAQVIRNRVPRETVVDETLVEVDGPEVSDIIEVADQEQDSTVSIIRALFGDSLGGVDVTAFGRMASVDGRTGFAPVDGHIEAFGAIAGRNGSSVTMGRKNGGGLESRYSWSELMLIISSLGLKQVGRPTPKNSKHDETYVVLRFRK